MTTLILAFDPIYGQCLLGLLGLATRELTYHKQDRQVTPYDVERKLEEKWETRKMGDNQ